jgi:hypothetical protein
MLALTREIVGEGHFSWKIVDGAIDAEINALKKSQEKK